MSQLIIKNLSKTYSNGVKALDAVSLTIPTGMFGLLGPNGAGKSTLMRTIATLQEPDEGTIFFEDLDVVHQKEEVRQMLGYLPQEFGLYPKVSAELLLQHLAVLKGYTNKGQRKELVDALLHKTNLYTDRKKSLGGFSGGMKQRFGIAQALISNPKLLIVDEPTAGLDPAERNRFHNLLCALGEQTVVILSTHIVDDIRELCPNMAILNKGRVLKEGRPLELISSLKGAIYKKTISIREMDEYQANYTVISDKLLLGRPVIHVYSEKDPGHGFQSVSSSLDDVYFYEISKNKETNTK